MRVRGSDATSPSRRATVRLLTVLVAASVVLTLLSLVLLRVTPFEVLRDPESPVVRLLDVRAEQNLPTWFNVSLLAVAAALYVLVGALSRGGGAVGWPWYATAALLAALSLDDAAGLHEQLEPIGRALGGGEGFTRFAWLVPGAFLGAGALVLSLQVARRMPRAAAVLLVVGAGTVIGPALALEAVGGAVLDGRGDGAAYILVSHLEELLETVGACLLLASACAAVQVTRLPGGAVSVRRLPTPDERRAVSASAAGRQDTRPVPVGGSLPEPEPLGLSSAPSAASAS